MHPIYFLGRFHVLILHLPIAFVLAVAGLEWLTRAHRRPELAPSLRILWAATAISALLTVILGYMHFSEGGFTGPSAIAHRALGTSVAIVATLGWLLRSRGENFLPGLRAAICALLVVLVTLTGHFGGNLTHGDTYLVEFAPNPIRKLAGLEVARPPVTDLNAADPFLDIVKPMFQARCASCHNKDKARGGLNLSSYATLMKGGKDGVVVVAGDAKGSDLVRRISLTPDKDDFMPKEGKTPLTSGQVAIVKWWVDAGAKSTVTLASLQVPAEIRNLLQAEVGGASKKAAEATQMAESLKSADPKAVAALNDAGFMARQVSRSDAHLVVTPLATGTKFSDAQLAKLASVPSAQVAELDLRQAGLADAALQPVLRHFTTLTRLHLDRNKLTDASVQALKPLSSLEVLDLYGNAGITDRGVDTLAAMKSLKRIFVWNTGMTPGGVEKLRKARPDLYVDFGDLREPTAADPPATAGRQ